MAGLPKPESDAVQHINCVGLSLEWSKKVFRDSKIFPVLYLAYKALGLSKEVGVIENAQMDQMDQARKEEEARQAREDEENRRYWEARRREEAKQAKEAEETKQAYDELSRDMRMTFGFY
jgi:hypothetical protein